jgi:hypothetical protein
MHMLTLAEHSASKGDGDEIAPTDRCGGVITVY